MSEPKRHPVIRVPKIEHNCEGDMQMRDFAANNPGQEDVSCKDEKIGQGAAHAKTTGTKNMKITNSATGLGRDEPVPFLCPSSTNIHQVGVLPLDIAGAPLPISCGRCRRTVSICGMTACLQTSRDYNAFNLVPVSSRYLPHGAFPGIPVRT
jgi:hypothetical protein